MKMEILENEFQYKLWKKRYIQLEDGTITSYQNTCLCSKCKKQIHNVSLNYKIITMRNRRNKSKLNYKIPIFCCNCHEKILIFLGINGEKKEMVK